MKRAALLMTVSLLLAACGSDSGATTSLPASTEAELISPTETVIDPDQSAAQSVTITNLALHARVSSSAALEDFPAEKAVDGISSTEVDNWWGAGDSAPQWIQIDFEALANIESIRLRISQFPDGQTRHRVSGCSASGLQPLHEFSALTKEGQWLSFSPEVPWQGYSCLRIETLESPSWVAWREIEIMGYMQNTEMQAQEPSPDSNAPSIIFHNGAILSMEAGLPTYQAIAIQGDLILQLGTSAEILALAGEGTQIIDLEGHSMMPGIVDAHTHVLSDSSEDMAANQALALENGFTTIGEMSTEPGLLDAFLALNQSGALRIRTNAYLTYTNNCGDVLGDWVFEHPVSHEFGEMFRIAGVKVFADGGTCGTLPAISWEYPTVGGFGDLFFSQEEMNAMLRTIDENGYQIAIHAQGDVAIEIAQNALGLVIDGGDNPLRHRIDHNPFHRPDLVGRYKELGIYPVIFGVYATCATNDRDAYAVFFGEDKLSFLENWRVFVDANPNWPIAWHGDDPWVVPLNPFQELFSMVTRAEVAEDGSVCEPPYWLAAHAITVEEALPMMTINSAFVLHRDEELGSLVPGKLADMLILSANPLTVDPYEIKDIVPLMTMIGGVVEFCQSGADDLCP